MTEQEILERYSTPGLRRRELSRTAKKAHLATLRRPITGEEAEKVLAELYPEQAATITQPAEAQAEVLEIIKTNGNIARKVLNDWIAKRVAEIERVTGIPRELLLPDPM
jgi:uncharacterized protein (DUF2267 family)